MSELVSIIMPAYNSAHIAESIESIQAQTYTSWELLITDDKSLDATCEIVAKYAAQDDRIKLFKLPENSGAGVARNNSIEHAKGRFIAFCDSDDMWLPEKLERQIKFMTDNDYDFTYTSYYICNEGGERRALAKCYDSVTHNDLVRDCSIGCLTVVYDTKRVGKVYLPSLRKRQDWGLWLKITKLCKRGYGIAKPLAKYRLSSSSISSNKFGLVKYNINVYRTVLGYSKLRSFMVFAFCFMPRYTLRKMRYRFSSK